MIFAVVGPSGAGKDLLIRGALARRPDLHLVRRVITRPADAGAEDHEPATEEEFLARVARSDFALFWHAHGLSYGLPKRAFDAPGDVIFNGSRAVLSDAARVFPGLRVVVVTAPDDILAARLAARGRESLEDIRARLARAAFTLPNGIETRTVVNDATPAEGIARFLAALQPASA
jgi:phosphonate metabolism protein PhnN/1,5-bisphosphokinase (PRPP-forming)